jgi:Zn-dependent alcohol dehydrogenase
MAVFGAGGIGLNVVQGGDMVAAHPIIAVDVKTARLDHARALGATHGVDASAEDPSGRHQGDHAPGRGLLLRGCGRYARGGPGVRRAEPRGHLRPHRRGRPPAPPCPFDVRPLVTGERVIRGCSYGGARTREDLPKLAELYLAGRLRIDELITHRYGLDDANEAFRALAAGELGRGLIVF